MAEKATALNPAPTASVGVVCALSLVLAGCSLLYELLIAQTLTLIAGNMVVWYSLTVGTYLAAMGLGAILFGSRTRRRSWSWKQLFTIEIALSLIGASAVILLREGHSLHLYALPHGSGDVTKVIFFASAFSVTFLIGILTGLELPLLIHLGNRAAGGRNVTNRVLGWDYIGALAGCVVFPLVLVPYVALHGIGFAIAALNLAVAGYVHWRFLSRQTGAGRRVFGCAAFGLLLVAGFALAPRIEQFFLKRYYFYFVQSNAGVGNLLDPLSHLPPISRVHSPYQKIDIVHNPDPSRYNVLIDSYSTKFLENPSKPRNRYLFLNGDLQVSSNYEEIYHEWFVHVPIIVGGKVPRRVLVMGGGDGLLHRELNKYDQVQSIVHVDLDDRLVNLAKTNSILVAMNDRALEDERNHTVFQDAFRYLRNQAEGTYDAIYLDFPFIQNYDLSKLYSSEFYRFVWQHLADDGFVALDAPMLQMVIDVDASGEPFARHGGTWEIHSNTMRQAGFKNVVPFYSNLEADNPLAYEALVRSEVMQRAVVNPNEDLTTEEAKRKWMVAYVSRFASKLRNSYIMLRKDEKRVPFEYVDFGIKLHVLNEKRFGQSFPATPDPTDEVDLRKVNSILRPTLPMEGAGVIRVPW